MGERAERYLSTKTVNGLTRDVDRKPVFPEFPPAAEAHLIINVTSLLKNLRRFSADESDPPFLKFDEEIDGRWDLIWTAFSTSLFKGTNDPGCV